MKFISDDYDFHMLDRDIKEHDMSKLSEHEFVQYRKSFYTTKREIHDKSNSMRLNVGAWEHHKENNNHHWQTWVNLTESHLIRNYIVHNIIDWMAMAYELGGSSREYFENNNEDITIPEWAEKFMYEIFDKVEA